MLALNCDTALTAALVSLDASLYHHGNYVTPLGKAQAVLSGFLAAEFNSSNGKSFVIVHHNDNFLDDSTINHCNIKPY